jgi:hypothetical protein
MLGSSAVWRYREPDVSRFLNRNRQPVVSGVQDPNKISLLQEGNMQENASTMQEEPTITEIDEVLPGVPSTTNIDLVTMIDTEIQDDSELLPAVKICLVARASSSPQRDTSVRVILPRDAHMHNQLCVHICCNRALSWIAPDLLWNQAMVTIVWYITELKLDPSISKSKIYIDRTVLYSMFTST